MQSLMDKQENYLRKRLHVLISKAGIDKDGLLDLLEQYNATSSRELDSYQLLELCSNIEKITMPSAIEMDRARKRLIASIGAWLRALNQEENIHKIKAIACRAASKDKFNSIGKERLNSLYYAFVNKTKDLQFVNNLTAEELSYLTLSN
ncbi:MAG: hypothetical protein JW857_10370 [Bacteroidales bacterium]|nr:hypothetical protein [Bacteroidales bacterium]